MRRLVAALVVFGCGGKEVVLGPTDQGQLLATLDDLAAMGQKQAGTPAGQQAAQYIADRMQALKLTDVHMESFQFPRWELMSKSMTVSIDGVEMSPGFDVFEASGSGVVDGEIVNVETATDGELAGKDLTGKVALVIRDPSFHRSSQYRNVQKAHASAMLYLSIAPNNLRQVGSTRLDWEAAGTIPALTIGADDGAIIRAAVLGGKTVRAKMDIAIKSTPGTGTNVVARIPGERPEMIVLAAHFDTWFTGSSDNGSGIAELLAVAARRKQRAKPRYTLVFAAFDGEEIGLYGGYDYLHKHTTVAGDPIVAVLNFESPSANDPEIAGLVHSNQPALDDALQAAHLRQLYGVYAGLEVVAMLFGGIIPTDIQGVYRSGIPSVTTAVTNAYYHTVDDTPDKVDLRLLSESSDAFDAALDFIMDNEPAVYEVPDHKLWTTEVSTTTGAMFAVDATFADGDGAPGANAVATASILVDDFTLAATVTATTDANGHVVFQLPPAALTMGSGNRFLHVTAGPTYPLVEKILALP